MSIVLLGLGLLGFVITESILTYDYFTSKEILAIDADKTILATFIGIEERTRKIKGRKGNPDRVIHSTAFAAMVLPVKEGDSRKSVDVETHLAHERYKYQSGDPLELIRYQIGVQDEKFELRSEFHLTQAEAKESFDLATSIAPRLPYILLLLIGGPLTLHDTRDRDPDEPGRKGHRRYIANRWLLVTSPLVLYLAISAISLGIVHEGVGVCLMLPYYLMGFWLIFHIVQVPLRYTVFGSLERTPLPPEEPILSKQVVGNVGRVPGQMIYRLRIWEEGFAISGIGAGHLYIPFKDVTGYQNAKKFQVSLLALKYPTIFIDNPECSGGIGLWHKGFDLVVEAYEEWRKKQES